jgi:hypothetical protein
MYHPPAESVNHHFARAGEFSTGTMGNFKPELTLSRNVASFSPSLTMRTGRRDYHTTTKLSLVNHQSRRIQMVRMVTLVASFSSTATAIARGCRTCRLLNGDGYREENADVRECSQSNTPMSARNKPRPCAYCGKTKKVTGDHIPPKLLIERPLPPNLLTVPACEDCNRGFMADDEYTRMILGMDVRAASHRAIISNMQATVRAMERPEAKGFMSYLASKTTQSRILAWNGNPLGLVEVDRERINQTGLHIVRGLYYKVHGKRVPEDAALRIGASAKLTPESEDLKDIARAFAMFPEHSTGAVGRTFSYATAFGHDRGVWIFALYDYFCWMATIDGL